MALVNQKMLTVPEYSGFTQSESLEQILAYAKEAYRREKLVPGNYKYVASNARKEKEIEYYERLLQQSQAIDNLYALCEQALAQGVEQDHWEPYRLPFR